MTASPLERVRPLLTQRQFDVLRLAYEGDSDRTIARRLGLSRATVRGHVDAIRRVAERHPEVFSGLDQDAG
ncbi:MAG TPA: LuxR C-terminal-related transcriptional regulator [Miltoncostaeaceae bacterium]|nr:LuxR C-terminal-related transcriptional regulator [Miltoncostaeaceae bacterium]